MDFETALNNLDGYEFYVYKITNIVNNKVYIGKSKFYYGKKKILTNRFEKHIQDSNSDCNFYIHRAMKKYGIENFVFDIISVYKSESEAFWQEDFYIKHYNSKNNDFGYNLIDGGIGKSNTRTEDGNKSFNEKTRGENNARAVLTDVLVIDIRQKFSSGEYLPIDIVKEYNINIGTINNMLFGRTWNHIENFPLNKEKYNETKRNRKSLIAMGRKW